MYLIIIVLRYLNDQVHSLSDALSGSSMDWAAAIANIKYAFTVELRDTGHYRFMLPEEEIIPSGQELWDGIQVVVNHIIGEQFTYESTTQLTQPTTTLRGAHEQVTTTATERLTQSAVSEQTATAGLNSTQPEKKKQTSDAAHLKQHGTLRRKLVKFVTDLLLVLATMTANP